MAVSVRVDITCHTLDPDRLILLGEEFCGRLNQLVGVAIADDTYTFVFDEQSHANAFTNALTCYHKPH